MTDERLAVKLQNGTGGARQSVIVAGGGIAGLYCAWQLGRSGAFSVTLLETRDIFGGRIETGVLDGFIAEYGPMRFEPGVQKRFFELCEQLGLNSELDSFPEMTPEAVEWPKYNLEAGEEGLSTLALLRKGVLDIFEEARELAGATDPEAWLEALDDAGLDHLRRTATLNGIELYRRGFWNALSEVLSHQAVMKIRDTGTFYHLIPENPNAVEWGIFWLRLFKPEGQHLMTVKKSAGGTGRIIDRLVQTIAEECAHSVSLQAGQEAVRVGHGREPGTISLDVRDKRSGRTYTLEAEHVVLALPQKPLLKLAANFPDDVRDALDSVVGFSLLKAFLVTNKPWWPESQRHHPQKGAGAVPTRELHYDRDEKGRGMVMLYTDYPATEFWRYFVEDGDGHDRAEVYGPGHENLPLKRALVRYLISQGQKERAARRAVERLVDGRNLAHLLEQARDLEYYPEAESIARDLLRLMEATPDLLAAHAELRVLQDELLELTQVYDAVTAYSIRDWSREPFGAAAHAWRPRARSWEVRRLLAAFGLIGRENVRNLHVCGEAYSDYQGYIEGALRTAADAVAAIMAQEGGFPPEGIAAR